MPREIIAVHIGQAGIQIGNAMWELFCLEHGLKPDGLPDSDSDVGNGSVFFSYHGADKGSDKASPRAVCVDLEPSVVDGIRTGLSRSLFHPDCLISGGESASNLYARGYITVGKELVDKTLDRIRKLVDDCDALQGFIVSHSVGGGTGSGFGALLLERLSIDFGHRMKVSFTVLPSPRISPSVVEPYNAVLATHSLLEHVDVAISLDNEALYKNMTDELGVQRPAYSNVNRLVAQVASSMTASMRFEGALNVDLTELQTNLVPYPRVHFVTPSFVPLVSAERSFSESLSVSDITSAAFDPASTMLSVNPAHGTYSSCCMMYRGDVCPGAVCAALAEVKTMKTVRFADWSPTGFKVGINSRPSTVVPMADLGKLQRALCMLANTSSIDEHFGVTDHKFDLLYARRAFVHWYVCEGMEEGEFSEAREDLAALERDYESE